MFIRKLFRQSPFLLLFAAAVLALGVAACSGDDDDSPATTNTPAASAATAAPTTASSDAATSGASGASSTGASGDAVLVSMEESDLGPYLVGPDGRTLYVFLRDEEDKSNCADTCLQAWPPLLVKDGEKVEGGDEVEGTFDTIDTPSGTQVTYRGAPLYYYAGDAKAGDTTGNLVGNVWFVARPETASTNVLGLDDEDGYLVGPNGMSLYLFAKDTTGVSNCSGTCLQNWPALTVPESLTVTKDDELSGDVATLKRDDGTLQVTYKGMPVYYYIGDKLPGDTTGDGVGGVWSLAKP
jgi:predicted lipoprotein with Yx(FWY)xxD motif